MSASTLISRFGKTFAYRRYAAGDYVDGLWVPGAESFLPVADQVQVFSFAAVPDAGGLALSFGGVDTAVEDLPGDLTAGTNLADWAAALTAAFEGLAGVGAGNVVVTLALVSDQLQLTVTFGGELAEAPQAEVLLASNTLTAGGEAIDVALSEITVPGVAPETRRTAVISLQVISGRELQLLPEGDRTKASRKGYTVTELLTTDEQARTVADRIEADGRLWEVRRVDPFPSETDLPHYRVLAVMVEDDNEEE
jgi:hypothetical protein